MYEIKVKRLDIFSRLLRLRQKKKKKKNGIILITDKTTMTIDFILECNNMRPCFSFLWNFANLI